MQITAEELRGLLASNLPAAGQGRLAPDGEQVIVVLQRGWVAVGKLYRNGYYLELREARIVRRWGTTQGLGQLAADGPRENTVLDTAPAGLRFHELSVVCVFPCSDAWR